MVHKSQNNVSTVTVFENQQIKVSFEFLRQKLAQYALGIKKEIVATARLLDTFCGQVRQKARKIVVFSH